MHEPFRGIMECRKMPRTEMEQREPRIAIISFINKPASKTIVATIAIDVANRIRENLFGSRSCKYRQAVGGTRITREREVILVL